MMGDYWNNSSATSNAFLDGWLMTGHMGSIDQDGYITLKDRSKDTIISASTNIYQRKEEEALITHRIVEEISVVGRQHPDRGEEVVAYIVLKTGVSFSNQELDQDCLAQIARFKCPKTI